MIELKHITYLLLSNGHLSSESDLFHHVIIEPPVTDLHIARVTLVFMPKTMREVTSLETYFLGARMQMAISMIQVVL